MIKIENVSTAGFEPAVRGMRNPMNSWGKSDSGWCKGGNDFVDCCMEIHGNCPREDGDVFLEDVFCVGKSDFGLMQRLAKAGTDHRKYLRMIVVYADITAPRYWWTEADTYKVGTVANSCSTMHKIHAKEFTPDDFSNEFLFGEEELDFERILFRLNYCRERFNVTGNKNWWYKMIQLLPQSYNQRRTLMMNYEVLANMYHARKNHKLDEWRQFCQWIESLPYSEIITGGKNGAE